MTILLYIIGIICGLLVGIITAVSVLIQKFVVNKISPTSNGLMRELIKSKAWVSAIIMQYLIGSIFLFTAQNLIGPALLPGLMACQYVVISIGSIRFLGERLNKKEIIGIGLIILGIILLSFSDLSIGPEVVNQNIMDLGFNIRIYFYTAIIFIVFIVLEIIQKKRKEASGILSAITSGLMFALNILWLSPLTNLLFYGFFDHPWKIISFVNASLMMIVMSTLGTIKLQHAFKMGQATNLVAIQQVPQQISPVLVYFFIFLLIPNNILSILFMSIGIPFIILSLFLLGKRQF